jgi:hypothetical protein
VNATTARLRDIVERLLPYLIVIVIVAFAWVWFIRTPFNVYLRTRTDLASLQARLKTVQESVARAGGAPSVDLDSTMREFERVVSLDDRVSDVTAALASAVVDSAPGDKLKLFSIETSDRVKASEDSGRGGAPRVTANNLAASPDPRFALFPAAIIYTPVKITYSSTFDGISSFIWKVRDLPTTIELKSATLTRGLPLMKMELLIWVYQRRSGTGQEPGVTPAPPKAAPAGQRITLLMGAEG